MARSSGHGRERQGMAREGMAREQQSKSKGAAVWQGSSSKSKGAAVWQGSSRAWQGSSRARALLGMGRLIRYLLDGMLELFHLVGLP